MSGQEYRAWVDFKYEGCVYDIEDEYKETYDRRLREEKRYDYAWEREWNNLYNYDN